MNRAFFTKARERVFNECISMAKAGNDIRVAELTKRIRAVSLKGEEQPGQKGAENSIRQHLKSLVSAGFMEEIVFGYNDKLYKVLLNADRTEFVPPLLKRGRK